MFVAILGVTVLMAAADTQTAQAGCDPNYAGSRVPNVAGGRRLCRWAGDGPYYTDGTQSFEVVGVDRYRLDTNDPDNLACEPPTKR